MSATVQELLKLVASPAELLRIAADLRISAGLPAPAPLTSPTSSDDAAERRWLVREGFAGLQGLAEKPTCAALVRGIEALRARELPATFVYAFDETWMIGEHIRERISKLAGHEYRLVEDVWAWLIPSGQGGWPPHRGIAHVPLDREAPEIVNVWIALSDVTADRACMHAIPPDDDPGYPGALGRLDAPLASVRALPASAGDALFWNANVLHWGGRCAERAAGPRVSCSFTLCRADATSRFSELVMLPPLDRLDLGHRMDALARMIVSYGPGQPDVSALVHEWAALAHGLATRFPAS